MRIRGSRFVVLGMGANAVMVSYVRSFGAWGPHGYRYLVAVAFLGPLGLEASLGRHGARHVKQACSNPQRM